MRAGVFGALIAAAYFALIPHLVFSERDDTLEGWVVAVREGDMLTVEAHHERMSVRLSDIDAPELDQPYSGASRDSLAALVLGKSVRCIANGRDRFGQPAARCSAGGLDINAEQVRRGMAWAFTRYRDNRELRRLQQEAQAARRGLWKDPAPVPPWSWNSL